MMDASRGFRASSFSFELSPRLCVGLVLRLGHLRPPQIEAADRLDEETRHDGLGNPLVVRVRPRTTAPTASRWP